MGCSPWGRTESDTTEAMQQQQQQRLLRPLPAVLLGSWLLFSSYLNHLCFQMWSLLLLFQHVGLCFVLTAGFLERHDLALHMHMLLSHQDRLAAQRPQHPTVRGARERGAGDRRARPPWGRQPPSIAWWAGLSLGHFSLSK